MQILSSLSRFDARNTVPELQNEFCALWNEIVQRARDIYPDYYIYVLRWIRHLYVPLHLGTDAAPTTFHASTHSRNPILNQQSLYPLCNIATHHPNTTVPFSTQSILGSTAPQEADVISGSLSSPDFAHPTQGLPPPSSSTDPDPVLVPPQVTSVTVSFSPQSSLSIANPSTKIGRIDEPTPDIPINEIGETSQTPATTFLTGTFPQHLDPVPVIVTTPSIVAYPPSVSVGQQGEFSDTPEPIASDLTLFFIL